MHRFRPIPLGHAIPNCPHAISVSLPTMADLIGYEEKVPEVMRQVPTGYPRFVLHPFVRMLTAEFSRRQGLEGRSVWLTATLELAEALCRWVGGDARVVVEGVLTAVAFAHVPERNARAKAFLQHCGGFISSRQAEDALVAAGLVPVPMALMLVAFSPISGRMVGRRGPRLPLLISGAVSYTHLRAHETVLDLVCRLLLEKKN